MQKKLEAAKQSYPELVRARAKETYEKAGDVESSDSAIEIIYEALKLTALESWKNGLAAAKRREKAAKAA